MALLLGSLLCLWAALAHEYRREPWVLESLVPFFLLPGSFTQIQLVATGPGALSPGAALTVTCKVSGDSIATQAWWNWVRQPHGRGLQWVGRIHFSGSTNYAPALKARSSITKDNAKNEYYLQLQGVTAADTGTYYCTRWDPQ